MKTEKEQKKIFVELIELFEMSDNGDQIIIWEELLEMYTNFEGGVIIKEKIYNLINLCNLSLKKSEKDFKILLEKDIETDIWNIV